MRSRRQRREAAVLRAIFDGHRHHIAIRRATGLPHWRVTSTLLRLEQEGRVYSRWEKPHEMPPGAAGPRRRLYFTLEFAGA